VKTGCAARQFLGLWPKKQLKNPPFPIIPVLIGPFDRFHTLKTLGVARL
jgi:hypothetical protein